MSQTVDDVTRYPLDSRIGVFTLDLRVERDKRHTNSFATKSSVTAQSANPEISCPPSRVLHSARFE
jgi:hypothetical protein